MNKEKEGLLNKVIDLEKENELLKQLLANSKNSDDHNAHTNNNPWYKVENIITDVSTSFVYCTVSDVDNYINNSLKKISSFLNASYAYIFFFSADKKIFTATHSVTTNKNVDIQQHLKNINAKNIPHFIHSISNNDILTISSVEKYKANEKSNEDVFRDKNMNSAIIFPINIDGEIKGFVGYDSEEDNRLWKEEEKHLVKITGQVFINAIEKRNTDLALIKSEEQYRLLVEEQSELIIKINPKGELIFVSPSYSKVFGIAEKDLIGKTFLPHVGNKDIERIKKARESLFKPPYTCYFEIKTQTIYGWKWFAWSDKALVDKNGNVLEMIGVGRDVTTRKNAQQSLHRHVKEMDTLNRFLRKLTSSLTISEVFKTIVNTLSKNFPETYIALYQIVDNVPVNKKSNIHKFLFTPKNVELPDLRLKIQECIINQTSIFLDYNTNNLISLEPGIQDLVILPCSGNHLLQVALLLINFNSDIDFNTLRTFLETVSNEISVALQNAYLYEEIKVHSGELFKANKDMLMEINERNKAEHALKSSEEKYRTLFENAADGIIIFDKHENILDVNDSFCNLISKDKYLIICKSFSSLFSDHIQEEIEKVMSGDLNLLEKQLFSGSNIMIPVEVNIKPLGEKRYQAFFRDITERIVTEEKLIETNTLLKAINNASPDAIFILNLSNWKFSFHNKRFLDLFQYTNEEIEDAENIVDLLVYEPDKRIIDLHYKRLLNAADNVKIESEIRFKRKDGKIIWVIVREQVFNRNANSQVIETVGAYNDISVRKKAEEEILHTNNFLQAIFHTSPDVIYVSDYNNHNIFYISRKIENLSLYDLQHCINSKNIIEDLLYKQDRKIYLEEFEKLKETKEDIAREFEFRIVRKNKQILWVRAVIIAFKRDENDNISQTLAIINDVSERKEAEKKVFDAIIVTEEKERESFAKNLHDDLGPLLSSIKMYLNSFQDTNDAAKQEYIVNQVNNILKEAIQCTKEVSNDLSPHILTNYGLVSAIESFIANFTDLVDVNFKSSITNQRFETKIEMTAFRVTKELINNTLKHAGATRIVILLEYINNKIHLTYTDNGKGFDIKTIQDTGSTGMGVFNIINRIKTLNGHVDFTNQESGVKYAIQIPAKLLPFDGKLNNNNYI